MYHFNSFTAIFSFCYKCEYILLSICVFVFQNCFHLVIAIKCFTLPFISNKTVLSIILNALDYHYTF